MGLGRKIFNAIFASIFSLALLFPIAIQLIHSLDSHQHIVCHEPTTHLHEKKFECSIFDFHFSNFTYTPLEVGIFHVFTITTHSEILYRFQEINTSLRYYYLRGPPQLS